MIYKIVSRETADKIIDQCEEFNIDYDIWNAEDLIIGCGQQIEIGVENWEKVGEI